MPSLKLLADLIVATGNAASVILALVSIGSIYGFSPFVLELLGYLLGG